MRRIPNGGRAACPACVGAVLLLVSAPALSPDSVVLAQTGAISGMVTLEALPPRRTVNRYAGGRAGSEEVQMLPVVVYLVGGVAGSSAPPATAEMVQRDTAFVPAAAVVGVGGSVDFPNDDSFFHNVFSYSSTQRFDLGRYPQGQSKAVRFDEPGIVSVFCEVHDKMRGVIIVTENPHHAFVGADGSFRIGGVPAGEHRVAFWSADHEPVERTVTVTAGGTARVEVELRR